jgi:sortase A
MEMARTVPARRLPIPSPWAPRPVPWTAVETATELVYRPARGPDGDGHFEFKHPGVPWWVTLIGRIGRTLIIAGLLVLGFVVYQLWGTGIQEARSQDRLRGDFADLLSGVEFVPIVNVAVPTTVASIAPATADDRAADTTETPSATQPTSPPTTVVATVEEPAAVAFPVFEIGEPLARLEIPKIGVDRIVVSGVERSQLEQGPGHYPDTPMPGQVGNAAIAGHRTTFGAPFYRVDELTIGDEIKVTTLTGEYRYVVSSDPKIISPNDFSVLDPTDTATLTLTSCHPRRSARQRIVIVAELDTTSSSQPLPALERPLARPPSESTGEPDDSIVVRPTSDTEVTDEVSSDEVDTGPVSTGTSSSAAEQLQAGWFSEPEAWFPTIGYGAICFAVALAGGWLSRRRNRVLAYAAVSLPFVVGLYFFYENVSRLLPPNI